MEYHVVDVFTTIPLEGNPLAVFADGTGIDTSTMQRIAKELNLSETTFILPAESNGDAMRVRIFTPGAEMDFAGHPTIGTAFVMRRLGLVSPAATKFALQENVGRVNVRVEAGDDPLIWLTTPRIDDLGEVPREACAAALSLPVDDLWPQIPCEVFSAGNPTLCVPVKDPASVDQARVNETALEDLLRATKISALFFVFAPVQGGAYSRMFAPHLGVPEDPATGSATGPLAAFMMKHGLAPREDGTSFISEQGTKMGRRSLLHVLVHGREGRDGIEVGGNVRHVAIAQMTLSD